MRQFMLCFLQLRLFKNYIVKANKFIDSLQRKKEIERKTEKRASLFFSGNYTFFRRNLLTNTFNLKIKMEWNNLVQQRMR